MTRFSATLIATAIAAIATPMAASAAPKVAASDIPAPTQETVATPTQRYCIVNTPTGSRVERRECKTLDAWLAAGVDPRTGR